MVLALPAKLDDLNCLLLNFFWYGDCNNLDRLAKEFAMDPRSMIDECLIPFLLDRLDRLPKERAPNFISSIKISVTCLKKVCVLLSLWLHKVCITISQFPHLFHLFFCLFSLQGVYYYFYQIFRNRAEAAALARWKNGIGDGSVGMFSSLLVAAMAGWFTQYETFICITY